MTLSLSHLLCRNSISTTTTTVTACTFRRGCLGYGICPPYSFPVLPTVGQNWECGTLHDSVYFHLCVGLQLTPIFHNGNLALIKSCIYLPTPYEPMKTSRPLLILFLSVSYRYDIVQTTRTSLFWLFILFKWCESSLCFSFFASYQMTICRAIEVFQNHLIFSFILYE